LSGRTGAETTIVKRIVTAAYYFKICRRFYTFRAPLLEWWFFGEETISIIATL
jgi:hypothetical protein